MKTPQDTEQKQSKSRTRGLIPFVKGDPRINRSGRPKCFDEWRKLAQEIAHTERTKGKGKGMTIARFILASWATSREPMLQKAFVEYAFGKVPDKLETTGLENQTTIIVKHAHEFREPAGSNGRLASLS